MQTPSAKTVYVCQLCGFRSQKWLGRCPGCGEWNSFLTESDRPLRRVRNSSPVLEYPTVQQEKVERITTRNVEFDRVLGGGLVPGSLVLLGGEPGIGKSTLLLQIAESLSAQGLKTLYIAGEESIQQIKLRGERLGVQGRNLFLVAETSLEAIFTEVEALQPQILIVDSIQTVSTEKLESIPGTMGQVRECAAQFLSFAKQQNIAVFLIGHITKEGSLAGPKALEHIVDVVLYFEGDRHQNQKIVRAVKNRFGPSNELGIFEMSSRGLLCVENPSGLFLSERPESAAGSVVVCAMQGSRPILAELQALVSHSAYGTGRRMGNGVDPSRIALLLAMLEKRVGLQLSGSDIYVNVVGGLALQEPAIDLAVVAAIVSSFRNQPIGFRSVVFGEVGLAGEVRAVSFAQTRLKEALAMGFDWVMLPHGNLPLSGPVEPLRIQAVSSVQDAFDALF